MKATLYPNVNNCVVRRRGKVHSHGSSNVRDHVRFQGQAAPVAPAILVWSESTLCTFGQRHLSSRSVRVDGVTIPYNVQVRSNRCVRTSYRPDKVTLFDVSLSPFGASLSLSRKSTPLICTARALVSARQEAVMDDQDHARQNSWEPYRSTH